MKKMKKGFTLIELVVVMALIAILSLLVVGAITVARNTAKATANRSNGKTIQTGLEALFARRQAYNADPDGDLAAGQAAVAVDDTCTDAATKLSVNISTAAGSEGAAGGCKVTAIGVSTYTIAVYDSTGAPMEEYQQQ